MFEDREMRLQLDVANKSVQFKYKIAIMLLHIHNFLLRAYHSMQSTLPGHQGSRGHYINSGRRTLDVLGLMPWHFVTLVPESLKRCRHMHQ